MTEAPVWGIVFAVILVVGTLTFFSLVETWGHQAQQMQEAGARQQDNLESYIAIQTSGGTSWTCDTHTSPFRARTANLGPRPISDLPKMYVLLEYTGVTGSKFASRLTYGAGWTVSGIVPDVRNPDLWDSQETATIQFTLSQPLQTGSNGAVVVVTPNGVADSAYFNCVPPINIGFLSPTAEAVDTGGHGSGFENDPTYAFADDALYAATTNGCGDRHRFYNYGFTLPPERDIFGIEVRADWSIQAPAGINSLSVELSWDGGLLDRGQDRHDRDHL
ncbi:MAG: hypothetical protein EXR46_06000 [Dehalococcoidia bacterium]|nr:hypothetical protein [Dehalococcoidia bacterium]